MKAWRWECLSAGASNDTAINSPAGHAKYGLVPKAGLYRRGLLKSLMDGAIPSPILENRSKVLRRSLSLFVEFPTALLVPLTPE